MPLSFFGPYKHNQYAACGFYNWLLNVKNKSLLESHLLRWLGTKWFVVTSSWHSDHSAHFYDMAMCSCSGLNGRPGVGFGHPEHGDSEGSREPPRHSGRFRQNHVKAENVPWISYFLNWIIYLSIYLFSGTTQVQKSERTYRSCLFPFTM